MSPPAPGAAVLDIEHFTPFRREGVYAPFPLAEQLADGRLALAFPSNDGPYQDHGFAYEWNVMTSLDGGLTWTLAAADDLSVPYNWPAGGPRERWDRLALRLPDGALLAAGGAGLAPLALGTPRGGEGAGIAVPAPPRRRSGADHGGREHGLRAALPGRGAYLGAS